MTAHQQGSKLTTSCDGTTSKIQLSDHADMLLAAKLVGTVVQTDKSGTSRCAAPRRKCYSMVPLGHRDQGLAAYKEAYFQDERPPCPETIPSNISQCKGEILGLDWAELLHESKKMEFVLAILLARTLLLNILSKHAVDFYIKPNRYISPVNLLRLLKLMVQRGVQLPAPLSREVVKQKLGRAVAFAFLSGFQKPAVELLPLDTPDPLITLVHLIQCHCISEFEMAVSLKSYARAKWVYHDVNKCDQDADSQLNVVRAQWLLTLLLATRNRSCSSAKFFARLCNCMRSVNVPLKCTICKIIIRLLKIWYRSLADSMLGGDHLVSDDRSPPLPPKFVLINLCSVSNFIPFVRVATEKRVALERRQGRQVFSTYVQAMIRLYTAFAHVEDCLFISMDHRPDRRRMMPPKLRRATPHALHLAWGSREHLPTHMCMFELRQSETVHGGSPHPDSYRIVYRGSRRDILSGNLMPSRTYHFKIRLISPSGLPLTSYSQVASYLTSAGSPCVFDRGKSGPDILVSGDGLTATYFGNESWSTILGSTCLVAEMNQWEVRIEASATSYIFIGVACKSADLQTFLGGDEHAWGFIGDRALYHKRTKVKMYGERFGEGDVIRVSLDINARTLSFEKNGFDLGVAFKGLQGELFPAVAFYNKGQRVRLLLTPSMSPGAGVVFANSPYGYGIDDFFVFSKSLLTKSTQRCPGVETCFRAFEIHQSWHSGVHQHVSIHGYPLLVDDSSVACLKHGVVAGQQIRTRRGVASVVGCSSGFLWCHHETDNGLSFLSHSEFSISALQIDQSYLETRQLTLCFQRYDATVIRACKYHNVIDSLLVKAINSIGSCKHRNPWNLTPSEIIEEFYFELPPNLSMFHEGQDTLDCVLCRSSLLLFFNEDIPRAFPFLSYTNNYNQHALWPNDSHMVEAESAYMTLTLHSNRDIIFASTKEVIFNQFVRHTTAQAKKADDDYDYPDDLPLIVINRRRACTSSTANSQVRIK